MFWVLTTLFLVFLSVFEAFSKRLFGVSEFFWQSAVFGVFEAFSKPFLEFVKWAVLGWVFWFLDPPKWTILASKPPIRPFWPASLQIRRFLQRLDPEKQASRAEVDVFRSAQTKFREALVLKKRRFQQGSTSAFFARVFGSFW